MKKASPQTGGSVTLIPGSNATDAGRCSQVPEPRFPSTPQRNTNEKRPTKSAGHFSYHEKSIQQTCQKIDDKVRERTFRTLRNIVLYIQAFEAASKIVLR